ncbi:MAG: TonB-dependent receptor [Chromatiaceae bacterium]|nr:TonB-dependent receptor [Chromatiaceae bacterium]
MFVLLAVIAGAAGAQIQDDATLDSGAGAPVVLDIGTDEGVTSLPTLVVTATRVGADPFDLPMAIDRIDASVIQEQQAGLRVSEALRRVPGTLATNRGSFAQEEQIQLRGFGARAQFGTRGVRLFADGIPASTPDGQGGPGLFALGSAARIEVLRGAFSALYGNHSGGVVQVFTEDPPPIPEARLRVLAGSDGTTIVGTTAGGPLLEGRDLDGGALGALVDAQRADTDGYRDWSRARKDHLNAKLRLDLPREGGLTLLANRLDEPDSQDPLGLTAAQVAADRRQAQPAALAFRTRRSLHNDQLGVVLDQPLGDTDRIEATAYVGRRGNTQYLAIPLAAQGSITASGGVSAFDREFAGGRVWWRREGELAGAPLRVTLGAELDESWEHRRGYENRLGSRGALKRDEDNRVTGWGGFLQTQWDLSERVGLAAGLRYTRIELASADQFICTPGRVTAPGPVPGTCSGSGTPISATSQNPDDSGERRYDAWTPALGLVFRLSPAASLYANLGRGFETPTLTELAYRPDGTSGLNLGLRAATSWQWEIGSKLRLGDGGRLSLALFQIDSEDEVAVATNQGGRASYQNAPASRRRGAELRVKGPLGAGFSGLLVATWLDARWTQGFLACTGIPCRTVPTADGGPLLNAAPVESGSRIPGVAPYTLFGELAYEHPRSGLNAAVELYGQGEVRVNDRNTESADGFWTLSLRAGVERRWGGLGLAAFARVDNLLGDDYIGAVIVNDANDRYYAPAPGTTYLVGLSLRQVF